MSPQDSRLALSNRVLHAQNIVRRFADRTIVNVRPLEVSDILDRTVVCDRVWGLWVRDCSDSLSCQGLCALIELNRFSAAVDKPKSIIWFVARFQRFVARIGGLGGLGDLLCAGKIAHAAGPHHVAAIVVGEYQTVGDR